MTIKKKKKRTVKKTHTLNYTLSPNSNTLLNPKYYYKIV